MLIIKLTTVLFIITNFLFISCNNTISPDKSFNSYNNRGEYRIMFYNVENFFDIYNDSLTQDDEFLPEGDKHWNYNRFTDKLNKIYKVIIAVGGNEAPEIIGLCEIENRHVLNKLIYNTPLSKYEYEIVHQDSPDNRGIDVALLLRKDKLSLLKKGFFNITFAWDSLKKTRDILYIKGLTPGEDTLHIFVNHWPSRYKGQLETESFRIYVASVLRNKIDSIFNINKESNIIITGDFNDEPQNKSIKEILSAETNFDTIISNKLYNLSSNLSNSTKSGSLKYKFAWEMFDQFIVSGSLLDSDKISTTLNDIHIFNPDFLLEEDNIYSGYRPYRTYRGYKYTGGFSDHLPIFLDLK